MSEDNNKFVTFEYDDGDTYLGEVNENGEPHGRGVLKSKDNYETTNGWFKNGLLHGEATISKGYNKDNEDETRKEKRKGNFVDGLMQGTHTYEAFRGGKFKKFIQEFDKDNLICSTQEDGTQEFFLEEIKHFDLLFSNNSNQKSFKQIHLMNEKVANNIDSLSDKLVNFSNIEIFFYSYFNWKNHKEKFISLFNSNNFDSECLPRVRLEEIEVKNREDVSSINLFIKYFITNVYRFYSLSNLENFYNFDELTIRFYDQSAKQYISDFSFWHNVHVGKDDLEKMKALTLEQHEKFCADILKNYSIHKWMELDNVYDIIIDVIYN